MRLPSSLLLAAAAALAALAFGLVPILAPTSPGEAPAAAGEEGESGTSFEQDGFRVTMDARSRRDRGAPLQAWEELELSFAVAERGEDGKPLTGLAPFAWLVRRDEGEGLPDRAQCQREIRALLAGRLAKASAVDLNQYYVVTLDENNSLSIVDPQLESARTKTIGMVPLPAKGADFALAPDRRTVLVTLPEVGKLAAADVDQRRARYLELDGRPAELALQPDGFHAWIGQESAAGVDVVRVDAFEHVARLPVGAGPHRFAFAPDSGLAFVLARGAGTVSVVDLHALSVRATLEVGPDAVALADSAASRRVYAARADGLVAVLDQADATRLDDLRLDAGVTGFVVEPAGRFAFALHRGSDRVDVLDTATGRVRHTIETERAPQRLEFTAGFGYLSHAASERTILIDLTVLEQEGRVLATSLPMGQLPPLGDAADTLAPLLAPLPEGGGAMLLSPADESLYHFMEGMNAPMGAYRTYPWPARGVLLVDRTLREVTEGRYAARFRAPAPGTYTVPFLVPRSPRLYGCFTLALEGPPTKPEPWRSLRFELARTEGFEAGADEALELSILDAASGEPVADLADVALLARRGPRWQWNGVARPDGGGRYRAELRFPEAGHYQLFLASRSRGIALGDLPAAQLAVCAPAEPGPERNTE